MDQADDVVQELDKKPSELTIDGQTWAHYHSEEGEKERLDAVKFAREQELCWPPCSSSHCDLVREYLKSRGTCFSGKEQETQP